MKTLDRAGHLLLAAALIWSLPIAAGPRPDSGSGNVLRGSFASPEREAHVGRELVLLVWNIERGTREEQIRNALAGPLSADLYALQEVDRFTRRTGYRDISESLARSLSLGYVFGVEFEELAQGRSRQAAFQGQALMARFRISDPRVLSFRHQPHNWNPWWKPRWSWLQPRLGGRMALVGEFEWNGRRCVIYNVHLESRSDEEGRRRQMEEIVEDLRTRYPEETPAIIAGDFNTEDGEASAAIRLLDAAGFRDALRDHAGPRWTKYRSRTKVDWIFVRGLQSFCGRIHPLEISDHYPLSVRLSLESPLRASAAIRVPNNRF